MTQKSIVIIGNGWAAMAAAGFYSKEHSVTWIAGTGSRLMSPVPTLQYGYPAAVLQSLIEQMGLSFGPTQTGVFLREFRNKSFREPVWNLAPTMEARVEVIRETLWSAEAAMVPVIETRFDVPMFEIEEALRAKIFEKVRRIENVPVLEIKFSGEQAKEVILGNEETIQADQVIFADRWNSMAKVQGMPKTLSARKLNPVGSLQAVFTHEMAVGKGLKEGFFAPMNKESGETIERCGWGYFFKEGQGSIWTVYIAPDEAENNHEITKKFRRLKASINKMFEGSSWLPEGIKEFTQNIKSEQVRFEEAAVFSSGEFIVDPISVFKDGNVHVVTDAYGFSNAMNQVGKLVGFNLEMAYANPKTKHMDLPSV
jgi:hypothetical protein